jgi:hypothetical protein
VGVRLIPKLGCGVGSDPESVGEVNKSASGSDWARGEQREREVTVSATAFFQAGAALFLVDPHFLPMLCS